MGERDDPGPPLWSLERPAPRAARLGLLASLLAGGAIMLLGPCIVLPQLDDLAKAVGPLWPGGTGASLTLLGALLAAHFTVVFCTAGWLRRRYGACTAHAGQLVFRLAVDAGLLAVARADVTGWDVGPHGVRVRATRHAAWNGTNLTRRHLFHELVFPLLIPARDPADVERVVAYLSGRDHPA